MKMYTISAQLMKAIGAGLIRGSAIILLAAAVGFLPSIAHAQNNVASPYEAAASFGAYDSNFLVQSGGQSYYNSELNSAGTSEAGTWVSGLDIAVAEDNYESTHSPAALQLVSALLNSFETFNGTDWSYDGWNDDIGWMTNVFVRGYQITGNTGYLTVAENNYNMAYSRGWSTILGGGIYENSTDADKECLSNDPFVWEGVGLYEATGNSTYLSDAEAIYSWVRGNLFNSTNSSNAIGAPGQLCQGMEDNGTLESGDNLYNSGSFLEAANSLYQITGNSEYYNDAVLDINHVMSNGAICSSTAEAPGNQWAYWFFKGLSDFCTDNNCWPTYYPFMLGNADEAWTNRCSLNLTWNQWAAETNPNSPATDALEMSSAAAIWQMIDVPQQYQIINENSGLAMDLISGNEANDAVIEQWSLTSGDTNQEWMVVPTPSGNYAIVSSLTNSALSISAASTSEGAQTVDWPYGINDTSQQFNLISEGNGWYYIQNINSGLVLDDDGGGTSNGTEIIQWGENGGSNQMWKLQPVTSFSGEYEIQSVASGYALNVSGGSTSNGAAVTQGTYSGNSSLWTFTPTSMGYYQILNVNSSQDLNVVANSYSYGADICQWPGGNQTADQWLPVENSNGTYTFYNLNSGLVLDDPGGSATQGTQFDQWGWNGGTNQEFNLILK